MGIFRERMKELREDRGLTQQGLADALNIGKSAIALYETEKRQPDPDTLRKLALFFNCSTDYLLGLTDTLIPERKDLPSLPPDILAFASDQENHGLIRLIQSLKIQGHSNELIREWLISLGNTIRRIKQTYVQEYLENPLLVQEPGEKYTRQSRGKKPDKKKDS